ncbi:ATP-dependent DNA helicase PcrA [Flaviflexus salsibiostraticola]|uniref:ATP-dependent DNA helicase UvrD1 n=1 Tax=Flaviflexus salsibiostraticola TaxID=1282737 RepID=A0A3Q8WUX6_9ACTO|nr:UvrD-helicase domain-containing protein [Flaviflexus salsibiostraticola]AZN29685.1 ATP-dependent DNA helicase PcrA [Flaviflexus salsibiostraticola]
MTTEPPLSALDRLRQRVAAQTAASQPQAPSPVPSGGPPEAGESRLLAGLNPQQRAAVVHGGGPLLVIAGAGSGKTRVLTHRIAHLVETGRAQPGEILAITFTNKAAKEMRERLSALLGPVANRMWISTFHSACVRILRAEHEALAMRSTFTIYDSADSLRLMNQVCREEAIDSRVSTPKGLLRRISDLKNELIDPEDFARSINDEADVTVAAAYRGYQNRLRAANALDFDDIIMTTVGLLQSHPAILEHYQRRFRHILVDEYQDTNHAQYVLIRELTGRGESMGELTVVGDADQSIYAFRGATIRNIESFEDDYPNAESILLEQNYRSTQNILSAANAVIANNPNRRAKRLWTDSGAGDKVVGYVADSEHDEARFLVEELQALSGKRRWSDIAVFYRTNAQSRALEEMLIRAGIPYKVIGGTRFYERKEIKDALAYLQVVANPDDTVAMRRIFNTPRRGLGAKAEDAVAFHAQRHGMSFGAALDDVGSAESPRGQVNGLTPRAEKAIIDFRTILHVAREKAESGSAPADVLDSLMAGSGYTEELRRSDDPQDEARVENLAELHAVAADFKKMNPDATLGDFLEHVALVSDTDQLPDGDVADEGDVTLMTVHTAKGLEFPVVFVTGFEDGTFPHMRSLADPVELAEERRLAYVALTRARENLYITRASVRSQWGAPQELPASRFLDEIPEGLVDWRRAHSSADVLRRSSSTRYSKPSFDGARTGGSVKPGRLDSGSGRLDGGSAKKAAAEALSPEDREKLAAAEAAKAAEQAAAAEELKRKRAEAAQEEEEKLGALASVKPGDTLIHRKFGAGTVRAVEGRGANMVATIEFDGKSKRLMLGMAPLSLPK